MLTEIHGPADPLDDILVAEAVQFLRAHSDVYQTLGAHRRQAQANSSKPRARSFEVAAATFAALRPHADAIKEWASSRSEETVYGD